MTNKYNNIRHDIYNTTICGDISGTVRLDLYTKVCNSLKIPVCVVPSILSNLVERLLVEEWVSNLNKFSYKEYLDTKR